VALCGGVLGNIAGLPEKEGSLLAVLVFAGFCIGAATHSLLSERFWQR